MVAGACLIAPAHCLAGPSGKTVDDVYRDGEGAPTYHVAEDGTVDWPTYEGFRRYGAACIHCHGPDGLGSSFAPSLVSALKTLSYRQFFRVVADGSQSAGPAGASVMPPFGDDPNVRCHIDAIYVYLRARADGAIPRGRPARKDPQTDAAHRAEAACSKR